MRRPARTIFTYCLSLLLFPCTTGCRGAGESWAKAQVPWGYVYDVGDTREIAAWTLAQDDAGGITAGWSALLDMILLRPREADDAIAGLASVYSKLLGGWPGYADEADYPRAELVRGTRRSLDAYVRRNPHPKAAELLATLKAIDPDADDPSAEVPSVAKLKVDAQLRATPGRCPECGTAAVAAAAANAEALAAPPG